jgi:hypothetical protein
LSTLSTHPHAAQALIQTLWQYFLNDVFKLENRDESMVYEVVLSVVFAVGECRAK